MAEETHFSALFEAATPERVAELAAFRERFAPGAVPSSTYLEWLCLRNPAGPAYVASVRAGEKLAAFQLLIPAPLNVSGAEALGHFCVEVFTHPDFRGKGLFSRLIAVSKESLAQQGAWLFGHPNKAAVRAWSKAKMCFGPELVPRIALPVPGGERVRRLRLSGSGAAEAAAAKSAFSHLAAVSSASGPAPHNRPSLRYSEAWLRWRYQERPGGSYFLSTHEGAEGFTAVVVSRPWRRGLDLAVDWWLAPKAGKLCYPRALVLPVSDHIFHRTLKAHFSLALPVNAKRMTVFATSPQGECTSTDDLTLAPSDF